MSNHERDRALMEGARNAACDDYFAARPQIDCIDRRRVYEAGFQAGAASRDAEIAELKLAMDTYFIERNSARDAWKRAADVRDQLRAELAAEQANNARLRDFIASAPVSSGVCCCGEAMDGHSSPMSCGHSPVDMWDHAVEKLLDAPSDTSTLEAAAAIHEALASAPEQSLAEYRNKVIEE